MALAALVTGLTSAVAPGTITGAGAGLCLLVFAAITLIARRLYTGQPRPISLIRCLISLY